MNSINTNFYFPNSIPPAQLGEVKECVLLSIFESHHSFEQARFLIQSYLNAFSESDQITLVVFLYQTAFEQGDLVNMINESGFALDKIADLMVLEEELIDDQELIPSLLSSCHALIAYENFDLNSYISKSLSMNKQVVLIHPQDNNDEAPFFQVVDQDSLQLQTGLRELYKKNYKSGMRDYILSSKTINTSTLSLKDGEGIQGLNLIETDQLCSTQEVMESIMSTLSAHLKSDEYFALLGGKEQSQLLIEKLKKSELNKHCLGYYPYFQYKHFQYGSFIRDKLVQEYYADKKIRFIILCSGSGEYLDNIRHLRLISSQESQILLPFFPERFYHFQEFEEPEPILVMTLAGSGTTRFVPVFNELIRNYGFEMCNYTEPAYNPRFMAKLKETPLKSSSNRTDLIQQIFDSQLDSRYRIPENSELESYYCSAVDRLLNHQVLYLIMRAFIPIDIFKDFENLKMIVLMRDPRDILISHYFALIHSSYYYLSQNNQAEVGYPEQLQEDILLELIEKGSKFISANKLMIHPNIQDLSQHYVQSIDLSNVFVIKFEDLHHRPEEAYLELFDWLSISKLPQRQISKDMISEKLYYSSFEFASDGKISRGREVKLSEPAHGVYRKGITGDWKNYFSPRIKKRVKELIGQDLILLGYEQDLNW